MAVDLHERADKVIDEASFLAFVGALAKDWDASQTIEASSPSSPYAANALGWENTTISAFLGAAAAWGDSSKDGLQFYQPPLNPWCRAAHILLAGKFYE